MQIQDEAVQDEKIEKLAMVVKHTKKEVDKVSRTLKTLKMQMKKKKNNTKEEE